MALAMLLDSEIQDHPVFSVADEVTKGSRGIFVGLVMCAMVGHQEPKITIACMYIKL